MAIDIKQEILDWFNANEVEEKAEFIDEAWDEFNDNLVTKADSDKHGWTTPTLASGPAYKVDDHGGEGQGEDYWVVFQVADTLYKVQGYYSSWDGGVFEDPTPFEVEPHEVTVIEYRRK